MLIEEGTQRNPVKSSGLVTSHTIKVSDMSI